MSPEQNLQRASFRSSRDTLNRLFQFLDAELRGNAKFSVREEYPSLFGEYPGGESIYIERNHTIVSHAGFVVREFQHPLLRMKMGLIGSVVTAPAFRGLGFATTLVREALQSLKRRGCVVAALWSDQNDFYSPLGFFRAGKEVDLKFQAETVPDLGEGVVAFDSTRHVSSVWRLYQKHESKVDRSLEEQARLCRIPEARLFLTEKDGVATSYIAIHKGADFASYIHEWAGDVSEVQRNVAWVQKNEFASTPLTLIAPGHYEIAPLKQMASERWDGVVGLIKVLDRNMLISLYTDYLKKSQFVFQWSPDKSRIIIEGCEFSCSNDEELIALVFGSAETSHPALPFFLWGFDSI